MVKAWDAFAVLLCLAMCVEPGSSAEDFLSRPRRHPSSAVASARISKERAKKPSWTAGIKSKLSKLTDEWRKSKGKKIMIGAGKRKSPKKSIMNDAGKRNAPKKDIVAKKEGRDADDGLHLPDVNAVLGEASRSLQTFKSQAKALEDAALQEKEAAFSGAATEKEALDQTLRDLDAQNGELRASIAGLRDHIKVLSDNMQGTKEDAHSLIRSNQIMRSAVAFLSNKSDVVIDFLKSSINTADAGMDEFERLLPSTPRPSFDTFLEQAREEVRNVQIKADLALVMIPKQDGDGRADHTLEFKNLSESLYDLSHALEDGHEKMLSRYGEVIDKIDDQHKSLVAEEERLLEIRSELEAANVELKSAKTHLRDMHHLLHQRLVALNGFADRVDETVTHSLEEKHL